MSNDGYACVLEFDTATTDFVRGVEVGRLWEIVKAPSEPVEEIVHASNAEMVLRIAEATGLNVRSEDLGDGWLEVVFTRR